MGFRVTSPHMAGWSLTGGAGSQGFVYGGFDGTSRLQDCDSFLAAGNSWSTQSSMPSPARQRLAGTAIGSSGYAFCGSGASLSKDTDELSSGSWTSKTDNPLSGKEYCRSAASGSAAYLIGGSRVGTRVAECDEYAPDAWTSKTAMPGVSIHREVDQHAVAANGGNVYVFGGHDNGVGDVCQLTSRYNVAGNSWASRTAMPSPERQAHIAGEISGLIYLAFGQSAALTVLSDTDEYNVTGDSWTSKTSGPSPARLSAAGSVIGSGFYSYGGKNGSSTYYQDCDEYIPDTWTSKTDMPTPARAFLAASTL